MSYRCSICGEVLTYKDVYDFSKDWVHCKECSKILHALIASMIKLEKEEETE